jgi:predicted nucleic acid-binding protein
MVLVDTSVWIRFLANRAPYAAELDRLLSVDEVAGHELVYGELLIGDRGSHLKLLTAYERIHQASFVPHRDVVAFVRHRNLQGRGAGWIDVHLLASAIVGRLRLWTADPRFAALANELGIAYDVLGSEVGDVPGT